MDQWFARQNLYALQFGCAKVGKKKKKNYRIEIKKAVKNDQHFKMVDKCIVKIFFT